MCHVHCDVLCTGCAHGCRESRFQGCDADSHAVKQVYSCNAQGIIRYLLNILETNAARASNNEPHRRAIDHRCHDHSGRHRTVQHSRAL